jgi:hypothetical protein
MKRIVVVGTAFAVFIVVLNMIACPIPYRAAQSQSLMSPLPTLELTPPHRPTPTGGPPPPDSAITPIPHKETAGVSVLRLQLTVSEAPVTATPRAIVRQRARGYLTLWEKHNLN